MNPICDDGCVMYVCPKCDGQFVCEHHPCDCIKKLRGDEK